MNNNNFFNGWKSLSIEDVIEKAKSYNKINNVFSQIWNPPIDQKTEGILKNIPFAIKDNFNQKNIITNSSSNSIKNHFSLMDSTIVKKLLQAGAIAIGKTNCDEFGMGGTGLSSCNGPVKNPFNSKRLVHGSSSGSAVAVALGIVPFALATDTGDSSRKPASAVGVVGFKPTWGLLSRRGVYSFAPSFDTVGFIVNNTKDIAPLLEITSGFDKYDFTSAQVKKIKYTDHLTNNIKNLKICYFKESFDICDKKYQTLFLEMINKLSEKGVIVEEISFGKELLGVLYPTYQAITFSEITSELAKITGISFGEKMDLSDYKKNMKEIREKGFGNVVKQRITLGNFFLHNINQKEIYIKAKKIRKLFINRINEIFKEFDITLNIGAHIPTLIEKSIKPKSKETNTALRLDDFLQIANMGGNPSLVIPAQKKIKNAFFSYEIMGPIFKDLNVLNTGIFLEEIIKELKNEV